MVGDVKPDCKEMWNLTTVGDMPTPPKKPSQQLGFPTLYYSIKLMIVLHHSSSMSRGWPGEITMLWWSYLLWSSYNKENAQESTWGSKHHQAGHLIFSDVQKNKKVTYFDIRPKNVRIASCQFRIRKFLYEVPWVFSNGCIEVLHPFKNSAAERVASLWATLSFSMGGLDRDSRGLLAEREREKRPLADTDLAQYV